MAFQVSPRDIPPYVYISNPGLIKSAWAFPPQPSFVLKCVPWLSVPNTSVGGSECREECLRNLKLAQNFFCKTKSHSFFF